MATMKGLMVKALVKAINNGQIFSVTFRKADGSTRKMVCRRGVTKHLKGGKSTIAGKDGLIGVYDLQAKGYRCFDVERVMSLRAGGVEYTIKGV